MDKVTKHFERWQAQNLAAKEEQEWEELNPPTAN